MNAPKFTVLILPFLFITFAGQPIFGAIGILGALALSINR